MARDDTAADGGGAGPKHDRDILLKFGAYARAQGEDAKEIIYKVEARPEESETKSKDVKTDPPKRRGAVPPLEGKGKGDSAKGGGKNRYGKATGAGPGPAFTPPPVSFMTAYCPTWGPFLTMDLRGIEKKATRGSLLQFMNKNFSGAIDFLYVPAAEDGSGNTGSAYMNFRTLPYLQCFMAWAPHYNKRIGHIVVADINKLDQTLQDFRTRLQEGKAGEDQSWHPCLIDLNGTHRALPDGRGLSANAPTFSSYTASVESNRAALKNQLEFYFSEDNLLKDVYLRSRMDKDGWAPIELIAAFPQVKKFLPSASDIVELMSASESVEVNSERTSLRAKDEKVRSKQLVM